MNPEDQVLFASTRQDFQDAYKEKVLHLSHKYALSWKLIFSKAERHGVVSLVYLNLCQNPDLELDIPRTIVDFYRLYTVRNTVRKEQRAQSLQAVLEYFDERSIDVLLIKGGVLDILIYDHPTFSTISDIDLVLRPSREKFTQPQLTQIMQDLHGSGIEYDFHAHHDMTINGMLPIDFERIWQDAKRTVYRDLPVWIMDNEDMLISLCINSCRKRYFRLKSLLDIAETIRKIKDLSWDLLAEKSRAYDCNNIVYAALAVTNQTLGCELPPGVLEKLRVKPLRAAVIERIIHYMIQYGSLPEEPISGRYIFGRRIHSSLLLPYATYRFYQVRHKLIKEIFKR